MFGLNVSTYYPPLLFRSVVGPENKPEGERGLDWQIQVICGTSGPAVAASAFSSMMEGASAVSSTDR